MFAQLTEDQITERLAHEAVHTHTAAEDVTIENTSASETRCAAVLVPLMRSNSGWQLLLTRRSETVESHKGQVAFPGGECDPGEMRPEQTALREAHEEIGIDAAHVRVLGTLAPLVTITGFRVTPVVGALPADLVFQLGTGEVERVFTMPLEWLADPANMWQLARATRDPLIVYHPFDGELLWGATAQIVADFIEILKGI